jgi:TrpR-related protein YerC/YecD
MKRDTQENKLQDSAQKEQFIQALLMQKDYTQISAFLTDVMTEGEVSECAKRLQTAVMLSEGATYPLIQQETGLSTTTIARVSQWLGTGAGGYKKVITDLHHHKLERVKRG